MNHICMRRLKIMGLFFTWARFRRKTVVNMFFFVVLKSRPVFRSQKLRKQTSRQEFQNGLIFHIGEVSELWHKTMVNNCHVSNLSNYSVVFKM